MARMDWQPYVRTARTVLARVRKHLPPLKALPILLVWVVVLCAIAFFLFFIYVRSTIPDPNSIMERQVKESTKIYDRTGETLLYDIYGEEKRTIVPWEKISDSIKKATLATEDSSFYEHRGFDIRGILRAVLRNVERGYGSGGGSTITQQLVGNALVGRETNLTRKLGELILAIEVERRFSKDQIFWMYLNQIPYGSNAYGIEAASQTYFGIHASDLSVAQAALLASLVQRPSYLSPYGSHAPELMARKDYVLSRMHQLGFITAEQYEAAKNEELEFKQKATTLSAPHFVIMAREYVVAKYGRDIVESRGFRIITTLDAELQQKAEELVTRYAKINKERYKANNAALVALDPRTGDVRALVGSADYDDIENEGNFNVITASRQPGSAFKPFAYAVALKKGYTDNTVLFDVKTEFNPNCSPDSSQKKDQFGLDCYHPQNYDGLYRGPVTLRQGLTQSLNVPSVKTLYLAGINDVIDLAENMGITTLADRSRFGLSLVLGAAEVRPIDLASAYGVFANDGIRNPWAFIQRIELADGTILEERQPDPVRVLDQQTARMVTDILSDNNTRAPVFGYNSSLYIPGRQVAAKTGTTQENWDAWVAGYTPSLVTVVWTGNNDNTSMTRAGAGISAAGPLWHEFMVRALAQTPAESFTPPNPVIVDKIMLNGNYVPPQDSQFQGIVHTILNYVRRDDPAGSYPSDPSSDAQFQNWEWSVRNAFPSPIGL